MIYLRFIILSLLFVVAPVAIATKSTASGEVTFIHMGDVHGHLIPRPNMRKGDESYGLKVGGLAYVYSRIEEIRARKPQSLLVNTGDTIQGSAEALYSSGQAMVEVLNLFNIDAFAPGNWDFMFGTERFIELFAGKSPLANWKAIAANLYYATIYEFPATRYADKAGQRVLPPYLLYQVGNVKVAILGLTAERGPKALSTRIMDGFYLTTGQDELQDAVKMLREKEKVDLLVLASERGLANNIELAERYPGIDVILSSDMHERTEQLVVAKTGTLIVEEGQDGTLVGELTVKVKDGKVIGHTWKAHHITEKNTKPNAEIAAKIEQIRKKYVKGYNFTSHVNPISGAVLRTPIDTVVGHTRHALHRANYTDAAITDGEQPAVIAGTSHDFIAESFRFACDAEVGIMRGFRYGTHVAPGPIVLEDLYHYIPVGPQVACGKISGDDIRLHIENSAQKVLTQYVGYWGGGWLITLAGVQYELDPTNEFGLRARNIRINGEALDGQKMYKVGGYWYMDEAAKINMFDAIDIRVLKDSSAGIIDATEVVSFYLRRLPSHTLPPFVPRVKLLKPLPAPVYSNRELQPLNGVIRPQY